MKTRVLHQKVKSRTTQKWLNIAQLCLESCPETKSFFIYYSLFINAFRAFAWEMEHAAAVLPY